MKRTRVEGSCAHAGIELSAVEFGNLLRRNGKTQGPGQEGGAHTPASHACCGCGQLVHSGGMLAGERKSSNGPLRGCACGSTLLLDIARSELYCCSCRDFIYLPVFDEGRQLSYVAQQFVGRGLSPGLPPHDPGPEVRSKRVRACRDPSLVTLRREAAVDMGSGFVNGTADTAADATGGPLVSSNGTGGSRRQQGGEGTSSSPRIAPDGFPAGLRGLNNLGNTCFMNSVLQVFIHSPLMRNYFLGQGHTQAACSRHGKTDGRPCLSCEMDAVFAAAYSGDRAPLSPADFLYCWWTFADSLAGYQQQDAHEFYLSALSGMASATITPPPPPPSSPSSPPLLSPVGTAAAASGGAVAIKKEEGQEGNMAAAPAATMKPATACKDEFPTHRSVGPLYGVLANEGPAAGIGAPEGECAATGILGLPAETGSGVFSGHSLSLVDMVFGGVLRSDVTCAVCGHTSTAYDPFLDISLDMVAFGAPPPHIALVPTGAGPPPSETQPAACLNLASQPPASGPSGAGRAGETDAEAEGVSRRQTASASAWALAGPSASACGGRGGSSQSASLPSPTRSLNGSAMPTGTTNGTGAGAEEMGEGEEGEGEEEGLRRRRWQRRLSQGRGGESGHPATSLSPLPSTSSGSGSDTGSGEDEKEGVRRRGGRGGGVVAGRHGKPKPPVISILTSASEDSCGPLRASGGSAADEEAAGLDADGDAHGDQAMRDTDADAAAGLGAEPLQTPPDAESPDAHTARLLMLPTAGWKVEAAGATCDLVGRRAPTPCTADTPGPEGLPHCGAGQVPAAGARGDSRGGLGRRGGAGGRRSVGGRAGTARPADPEEKDAAAERPGRSHACTGGEDGNKRGQAAAAAAGGVGPIVYANSDSVAAAESAACGGGGGAEEDDFSGLAGSPELAGLAADVAPDECITSPRAAGGEVQAAAVLGLRAGGQQDGICSPLPPHSASGGPQPTAVDLIVLTSSPSDASPSTGPAAAIYPRTASGKREPAAAAAGAGAAAKCTMRVGWSSGHVAQVSATAAAADDGPSPDEGGEQGSRGVTPGASTAEDGEGEEQGEGEGDTTPTTTTGAGLDEDEAGPDASQQGLLAAGPCDKDQELGPPVPAVARPAAGRGRGPGAPRAARGRGRGGGRGRRGVQSGRSGSAGAGGGRRSGVAVGGGGSAPQMGQRGASAAAMVDPGLTRRPAAVDGGGGAAAQAAAGFSTLLGCLRHFVTPERLSASEAWVCGACQQRQPAVKQLSIRRLPPVLALHVKRFEQRGHHHHHHQHHRQHQHQHHHQHQHKATHLQDGGAGMLGASDGRLYGIGVLGQVHGHAAAGSTARPGRHSARKLQTQLQFPLSLDLTPYTTPSILRDRYGMRLGQGPPESASPADTGAAGNGPAGGSTPGGGGSVSFVPIPGCQYRLFAVISHKGDLSGGHYVVFVRPSSGAGAGGDALNSGSDGGWYQCDDAWVTAVSEEDVTACQAYMLFYSSATNSEGGGTGSDGE